MVSGKVWDPVNRFNHTSWVAIVTLTDRPKSVRNRCVIEVFGGVFVLSRCFLDFFVGVGAFVIGLSQISFFFSLPWSVTIGSDQGTEWLISMYKCISYNIYIQIKNIFISKVEYHI